MPLARPGHDLAMCPHLMMLTSDNDIATSFHRIVSYNAYSEVVGGGAVYKEWPKYAV